MKGGAESLAKSSGEEDVLRLEICMLSGEHKTLESSKSTSLDKVCATIEDLLGIPATCQKWLLNSHLVSFNDVVTLGDVDICDGDQLTVLHNGFTPMVPLPEAFSLKLISFRQRIRSPCSSSFVMMYRICGNVATDRLSLEPWRKNDHDRFVYDRKRRTTAFMTSHWMSGETKHTSKLKGIDPLTDLLRSWHLPTRCVFDESDKFWLPADKQPEHEHGFDDDWPDDESNEQVRPNRMAVNGWFIIPSEDCFEVQVDIVCGGVKIIRMLLDSSGMPVRAALKNCSAGSPCHQDIEEFDVELKELECIELKELEGTDD